MNELLEAHQRGLILELAIALYPTRRYNFLSTEATVGGAKGYQGRHDHPRNARLSCPYRPQLLKEVEIREETNSVMEVRKAPHLLLGPISRVNHDCKANTTFVPGSRDHGRPQKIWLLTKRIILCGEEITATYQNHLGRTTKIVSVDLARCRDLMTGARRRYGAVRYPSTLAGRPVNRPQRRKGVCTSTRTSR
jgi:hypothetical protein